LFYNALIDTDIRFSRLDTKKEIGINYHPEKVVNPMQILMSAIGPDATPEDKKTFPKRFQEMVKTIFENGDAVIEVIEK
jgi:GTP cyclohydrolase I